MHTYTVRLEAQGSKAEGQPRLRVYVYLCVREEQGAASIDKAVKQWLNPTPLNQVTTMKSMQRTVPKFQVSSNPSLLLLSAFSCSPPAGVSELLATEMPADADTLVCTCAMRTLQAPGEGLGRALSITRVLSCCLLACLLAPLRAGPLVCGTCVVIAAVRCAHGAGAPRCARAVHRDGDQDGGHPGLHPLDARRALETVWTYRVVRLTRCI